MSNIYDSANQIEREIRTMPEFIALKEAFEAVKADSDAFQVFQDFQALQMQLQEKSMQGQEITDEDATKAQEMATKVQASPLINTMMEKEQAFSTIMNDLNRIIMTPVRDMYQG